MSAPLFVGPGLVARTIEVDRADVAWVRYVVEAHDGLANLHGDKDGTVTLVTTPGMLDELDRTLADLVTEIGIRVRPTIERSEGERSSVGEILST